MELTDELTYLKDILDTLPLRIYWKDVKGMYLGCNKRQADFWNVENPDAIVGKTDADLHFRYRLKSIKESDQRVIQDKAPIMSEDVTRTGRGEERAVLTHKMPLVNNEGKVVGIVGVMQDVTEERLFLKEKVIRDQSHDLYSLYMGLTTLQRSLEALIKQK